MARKSYSSAAHTTRLSTPSLATFDVGFLYTMLAPALAYASGAPLTALFAVR